MHIVPQGPQVWWPGLAWWLSWRDSNIGFISQHPKVRKISLVDHLEHHLDLMIFQAAGWAPCNPKCNPNITQWLLIRRLWKWSRLWGWESRILLCNMLGVPSTSITSKYYSTIASIKYYVHMLRVCRANGFCAGQSLHNQRRSWKVLKKIRAENTSSLLIGYHHLFSPNEKHLNCNDNALTLLEIYCHCRHANVYYCFRWVVGLWSPVFQLNRVLQDSQMRGTSHAKEFLVVSWRWLEKDCKPQWQKGRDSTREKHDHCFWRNCRPWSLVL
jgi:hypothetical protein